METFVVFTVALLTTLIGLVSLNRLAPVIGLLDHPNARKVHLSSTPLTGGLSIALGASSLVIMNPAIALDYQWLFIGAALLVLVGSLDDAHNLKVEHRIGLQAFAAGLAVFGGGVLITNLGHYPIVGTLSLPYWSAVVVTFFAILSGINAFNLIDGLDGLAASLVFLPLALISGLSFTNGLIEIGTLSGTLCCCIAVFLSFNLRLPWQKQARAFLGDAGSTSLGFIVACLLIRISQSPQAIIEPTTALWLIAIPLIDTFTVISLRVRRGSSAFKASKDHLHHILMHSGCSVTKSWSIIIISAVGFAVFGLMSQQLPNVVQLGSFATLLAIHLFLASCFLYRPMENIPHRSLVKIRHKIDKNLAILSHQSNPQSSTSNETNRAA